jgi:uncharacterized protein YceK
MIMVMIDIMVMIMIMMGGRSSIMIIPLRDAHSQKRQQSATVGRASSRSSRGDD